MSNMLPMAIFGLEVPAGDVAIPAKADIPSAFRITMAAIDPSAQPEGDGPAVPRATLKIIRQALEYDDDDDDDDDEDFDIEEMERMLAQNGDDESDASDEDLNGGPSDPAKSKQARKAAAAKAIKQIVKEGEMDVDETPNGTTNGVKKSVKALGKMPASDESEDDDDDSEAGEEWEEFVICTLDPTSHYNQPLDITVGEGERVLFKVSGTHSVFLTGNYVEPASSHGGPGLYDPDSDEDDEDYDLEPDSDELEEDELDEMDDPRVTEVDTEDEEEEEAPALVQSSKQGKKDKKDKKDKKGKNKRPAEDEGTANGNTIDDMIAAETNGNEQKLSKKQLKKLKKNDGSAAVTAAEKERDAPSSAKSDKKVSFAKVLEQGPTPTKDGKAGEKEKSKAPLGIKVVQGVTIDDKKLGTGPSAKNGDRVSMRYIGKLPDGKVFDSNKKGKPFSFKLGSGEVIKGWDIGIQGLSAGGERRITIPAHLAYGSKGVPGIPGNSTLVFDVKLLEISKK